MISAHGEDSYSSSGGAPSSSSSSASLDIASLLKSINLSKDTTTSNNDPDSSNNTISPLDLLRTIGKKHHEQKQQRQKNQSTTNPPTNEEDMITEEMLQDPTFQAIFQSLAENPELAMQVLAATEQLDSSKDGKPTPKQPQQPSVPTQEITPIPGFVVKTRTTKTTPEYPCHIKVFLNICHSPAIPSPPPISNEDLKRLLRDGDESLSKSYKIPLSLSSIRNDVDRAGKTCLVVDVCLHSDVYHRVATVEGATGSATTSAEEAELKAEYARFVMALCLEWVEQKFSVVLDRDLSFPRMKSKGPLTTHVIRRAKRPAISEVKVSSEDQGYVKPAVAFSSINNQQPTTQFIPIQQPEKLPPPTFSSMEFDPPLPTNKPDLATYAPSYIILTIPLHHLKSIDTKLTTLEISSKSVFMNFGPIGVYKDMEINVLDTFRSKFGLDRNSSLDWELDTLDGGAMFDRTKRELVVTLTVVKL